MRFWTSFLCILLMSGLVSAQSKKFLVTPNQEVVPLTKNATTKIMSDYNKGRKQSVMGDCNAKPIYGFSPTQFPEANATFGFYHNDICGEWFVVPADGTIDTVYFHTLTNVGPSGVTYPLGMDSTVYFRIFTSFITPTAGPGIRPGPYRPPCTSWGYWVNTADNDQGVAGFREDATRSPQWIAHHTPGSHADSLWIPDSSWNPTNLLFGDAAPSFPPFGDAIWGQSGYPIFKIQPNSYIKVPMEALVPLTVHRGDVIFMAFQCKSGIHLDAATQDVRFEISETNTGAPYPSRDWKFYEHDSGPSNCAGINRLAIKRGWVPRGSTLADDTTLTSAFNMWFAMTPTANIPPIISQIDQIHYTSSHDPQTFSATIFDCDAQVPARAGVANAYFRYRINGVGTSNPWTTLPLTPLNIGDLFNGTIPGQPDFTTIEYYAVAFDSTGAGDSSAIHSYRTVGLQTAGWYRLDTTSSCAAAKIAGTGTTIDTAKWFIAPRAFLGTQVPHRGDDGTAGPYSIGSGFVFYGDTMHYAWIGVNGAIALSKTATDTVDVNSNGFATDGYDFPNAQHHSRLDTLHEGYMPKAFIAPYWGDWIVKQDSPLATFGHIRYQDDTAKFVAEWDSIGAFFSAGAQATVAEFRVVLNKSNNSIEFQYDDIGEAGIDTLNLTGMQSDSNYHPVAALANPPFTFWNKDGFPAETHLRNGLCIHYIPVVSTIGISDGWNLLSVPATYSVNTKEYLYPTAISNAFIYNGGYVVAPSLTPGPAFWLKFTGSQTAEALGRGLSHIDMPVVTGWNMLGSINSPVAVANVTADAGTGISGSSTFFYYAGGYNIATSITPGLGYWVRATGSGQVHLTASGAAKMSAPANELANMTKLTVTDKGRGTQKLYIGSSTVDASKYEMPPRGPEGTLDARFASNSMVETFPSALDPAKKYEYAIQISATQYPVTIKWDAPSSVAEKYSLTMKTDNGKILGTLSGNGKVTLNDASVKRVMISVTEGSSLPKVFALGRNYPNPFNPTTQFTVEMPRAGEVEVSVYDLLGRKIATLLNGEQSAGYHTMEWDSHDAQGKVVASGVYLIRMNVPSEQFSATQKVMLLK